MSSKVVNDSSMFYMDFCPNCSNLLHLDEYMGEIRHKCQACPYFSVIKNIMLASRSFYKLKVITIIKLFGIFYVVIKLYMLYNYNLSPFRPLILTNLRIYTI